MNTINTIWDTAEADAWSRDFGWDDYIRICEVRGVTPINAEPYKMLCAALTLQFEASMAADNQ